MNINSVVKLTMLDRAKGALVGLALGDALGTSLEFMPKDSYPPLLDLFGGGPFNLVAGQWTDDTSMMLCLADSLLAKAKHDAKDQMDLYCKWWQQGHNSVNGHCFDIGGTVFDALSLYQSTGNANAGSTNEYTAGNGSLMRLAPVSIFYSSYRNASEEELHAAAKLSSITTHAEQRAVEACQIMAWLLYRLFDDSERKLSKNKLFELLSTYWGNKGIHDDLLKVVTGSFLKKSRKHIHGTGFVVQSLEAALWSFANSDSFQQGALLAANLGDDADTTAAIYGQLAGAYYGYRHLPLPWLEKLAWHEEIKERAVLLSQLPTLEQLKRLLNEFNKSSSAQLSESIYKALYVHGCILTEYRWKDYPNRDLLLSLIKSVDPENTVLKRQFFESLTYIECFEVITVIVRQDRFSHGLWNIFVSNGSFKAWLECVAQFVDNKKD